MEDAVVGPIMVEASLEPFAAPALKPSQLKTGSESARKSESRKTDGGARARKVQKKPLSKIHVIQVDCDVCLFASLFGSHK